MARFDANTLQFEEVELLGKTVLFSDLRVQRDTVPPDMYCYELRHSDDDTGTPCQLAKGILVNHFGSILSFEPYELDGHGYLDFDGWENFSFTDGDARSLSDFREKYGEKYAVKLEQASAREEKLFYMGDEASALRYGGMGYLRGYYMDGGERLDQMWFPLADREAEQDFHQELNTVMRKLFGQGIISTRPALERFCLSHPEARIPGASYRDTFGFKAETDKTSYYFRFNLQPGDYAVYVCCYDRDKLREHEKQAAKKKAAPER